MSPITTHVLDTARGVPAQGVAVVLELKTGSGWKVLARGRTNADGRVAGLIPEGAKPALGVYRLTFATEAYFKGHGRRAFYPDVTVVFRVRDARHHHVPLLLSPFGYSTYRGS